MSFIWKKYIYTFAEKERQESTTDIWSANYVIALKGTTREGTQEAPAQEAQHISAHRRAVSSATFRTTGSGNIIILHLHSVFLFLFTFLLFLFVFIQFFSFSLPLSGSSYKIQGPWTLPIHATCSLSNWIKRTQGKKQQQQKIITWRATRAEEQQGEQSDQVISTCPVQSTAF